MDQNARAVSREYVKGRTGDQTGQGIVKRREKLLPLVQVQPRFGAKEQKPVSAATIGEYILGIDVLQGRSVDTQYGLFVFGHPRYLSATQVREVRALTILRGSPRWEPVVLPPPTAIVSKKQHRLPGGEEEITQTISALLEAKVIQPTLSPYNSPLWPVQKPDGTWHMTVDYRKLNKVTPRTDSYRTGHGNLD
ncbi:unnamed protein product [Caretta caretta]